MPKYPWYPQPYRGDGRSNLPKRFPLSEDQKSSARGFGCMVLATVIVFVYLIFIAHDGATSFMAIACILFLGIAFFAMRDALGIKTLTPDKDERKDKHPNDEEGQPSLLEDYIAQVEWNNTHRKRHHPSHWSVPEPEWRFKAVRSTSDKAIRDLLKKNNRFFWISLAIGMFIFFCAALIFGINSPITMIVISITCLAFLANYLIRD